MSNHEAPPSGTDAARDAISAALRRVAKGFGYPTRVLRETADAPMDNAHGACSYVEHEIGASPDADVRDLEDFPEVVEQIVDNVEASYGRSPRPLPGQSADAALTGLGCATCRFVVECPVRRHLDVNKNAFDLASRVIPILIDLYRSPQWLIAARRQRTGLDPKKLKELEDETKTELDTFDIDNIRIGRGAYAGIVDARPVPKADIPEIGHIASIFSVDEALLGVPIVAGEHKFVVFDASEAVGSKDGSLSGEEAAILYAKLLGRIIETDSNGEPQIMNPDNIMQKVIAPVQDGVLHELRMSGKNRLYITLHAGSGDEDLTRIVILGGHGGDAATQRKFIDRILPPKSK